MEVWQRSGARIVELTEKDQSHLEEVFSQFSHCQLLAIRELLLILSMNNNAKYLLDYEEAERIKDGYQDWHYCEYGFCKVCGDERVFGPTS